MPLTSQAVDALGVVTISLVSLLVICGLTCIIYIFYFRARIQRLELRRLGYFNGPWIVRIFLILFGICWGFGEIIRLSLFRKEGKVFHSLSTRWQEDICKIYILSNLGFTEPCLFLIMSFLLRASLKWRGSGIITQTWNFKTIGYVLLYCLPIFILDLLFVIVAPKFRHGKISLLRNLPLEFTRAYMQFPIQGQGQPVIACSFPLLCTMLHGLFAIILTLYLLYLGRRMVLSVINKGLQRRVYILIFVVLSFLALRVLLLGFSVLARHERILFEALAFSGFLVLLSCVVVGNFMLVFLPVKDSLALNRCLGSHGLERERYYPFEDYAESLSLMTANQNHCEASTVSSLGRNSDASTKRGSISFRTMIKDDTSSTGGGTYEEEMSTFSPGFRLLSTSSPGSPAPLQMKLPAS